MADKDKSNPQPPLEGSRLSAVDPQGAGNTAMPTDKPKASAPLGDWLNLARVAYDASTDFIETNHRRQWERNLANFRSRHPSGSKYSSEAYRHRSKLFRPKSRSMVRHYEAATAAAFFSSQDVVSIQAEDDSQELQRDAAELMNELLNYRLTQTVPWFMTCLGAMQDAAVQGVAISHQYWCYEEDDNGRVVKDEPMVELIPVENIRISAAASWIDPVNSSPYLIHLLPMYVCDVMERIERGADPKTGEPAWLNVEPSLLRSGDQQTWDSTRREREGRERTDSKDDQQGEPNQYDIVWIHRNIVRRQGRDWLYYTVGTRAMLSRPVPLESVYLHAADERPYTMGCAVLETHHTYPAATIELTQDLQSMANEIANQRIDNVRQVMNRRKYIKEGQSINLKALLHNVPGGVIPMQNPQTDIKEESVNDVTASAYQEQDRINVDFDDLSGQFSTGSVQSNRSLNETVGGMNIMAQGANQITEYTLKIFAETWVEPVLRQLLHLEAAYETDETILATSARKVGLREVVAEMFTQHLTVSVNVGMGAVNPVQKIERLSMALTTTANVAPNVMARIKEDEVVKEIFGNLGYADGARFFQGLEQDEEGGEAPQDPAMMQAQSEMELERAKLEQQGQLEREKLAQERELKLIEMEMEMDLKREEQRLRAAERATQAAQQPMRAVS